jgi:predicted ATPase
MKRYILTGTPGCGKTSLIRALEMTGANVVGEAATDVIAYKQMQGNMAPWEHPEFIDDVIWLQKHRQLNTSSNDSELYFFDRSPICTYALALYLDFKPSKNLMTEIENIQKNQFFKKQVFFIENLGFITNTDARKISFEESLKFEQVHLEAYQKFGYECVKVPVAPIIERTEIILRAALKIS